MEESKIFTTKLTAKIELDMRSNKLARTNSNAQPLPLLNSTPIMNPEIWDSVPVKLLMYKVHVQVNNVLFFLFCHGGGGG